VNEPADRGMSLNDAIRLEEELARLDPGDPRRIELEERLRPWREASERITNGFRRMIAGLDVETRAAFGPDTRFEDVYRVIVHDDERSLATLAEGLEAKWHLYGDDRSAIDGEAPDMKHHLAMIGILDAARRTSLRRAPAGSASELLEVGRRRARAWLRGLEPSQRDESEKKHQADRGEPASVADRVLDRIEAEQILGLATPAEREVLELLDQGETIAGAARRLDIRPGTARQRVDRFRRRFLET